MATIRCKACGKLYSYEKEGCCPGCGAYNRPPKRERVNADGTPYASGQRTFFELETPVGGALEEGDMVTFRLSVLNDGEPVRETNSLTCGFGETARILLSGSREKGYTIARAD